MTVASLKTVEIRTFGDPILRKPAEEISEINGSLAQLCENMFSAMNAVGGIGLAAPQIGVGKRLFVYLSEEQLPGHSGKRRSGKRLPINSDEARHSGEVIINPRITESDGTWRYEEGCLSVPGYSWEIERPRSVALEGVDINGNEIAIEADALLARLIQHEIDHLDGVLLVERLNPEERKDALRSLRLNGVGEHTTQQLSL